MAAEPGRKPEEVARELLEVYGKRLDEATYIPALAVYCRWRFGELTGEKKYLDEVRELVSPYLRGEKTAKTDSQVALAGHLAFAALLDRSRKPDPEQAECFKLVLTAADSTRGPKSPVQVRSPKPEEMSDAVFMCGPVLCEAGAASDDHAYFQRAAVFLREMSELRQREDGLYAHGHLCDAAWGRGNGFPAVGAAWCLSLIPENHDGRHAMLRSFKRHMEALRPLQDESGAWRQVIDVPESQLEFTCTAMIGYAMQRGVSRGWLFKYYQASVDKAWQAICRRIEPGGKLLGVCESTGTQKSLEAYLARKLNNGVDQRGGAMALLFATELLAAEKAAAKE